jgi:pyridoxine/pyridoxamine 5'-phosphate oxidase
MSSKTRRIDELPTPAFCPGFLFGVHPYPQGIAMNYVAKIYFHVKESAEPVEISGSLMQAKRAASRAFRDAPRNHMIVLWTSHGDGKIPTIAAWKQVGARTWEMP